MVLKEKILQSQYGGEFISATEYLDLWRVTWYHDTTQAAPVE